MVTAWCNNIRNPVLYLLVANQLGDDGIEKLRNAMEGIGRLDQLASLRLACSLTVEGFTLEQQFTFDYV